MKVDISNNAQIQLNKIIDYIKAEWGEKAKDNFLAKLSDSIKLIRSHPNASPKSNTLPNLRRRMVVKQVSIFYTILEYQITIIAAFDNRMNPNSITNTLSNLP
jgi:plasmid stabilization system protein ParE|tara:strand:- start:6447 stop:6755 length:309 start_codon:yes stop_codon:yes gene_type:complete